MTSQPRDKTRDSTKHDTAKFGIDLYKLSTYCLYRVYRFLTLAIDGIILLVTSVGVTQASLPMGWRSPSRQVTSCWS